MMMLSILAVAEGSVINVVCDGALTCLSAKLFSRAGPLRLPAKHLREGRPHPQSAAYASFLSMRSFGGESRKRFAPAAERNTAPILDVLKGALPAAGAGRALAIAEGSGQHVTAFARSFANIVFLPSEADPECLASISAYVEEAGLTNVLAPVKCDCTNPDVAALGDEAFDLVYAINLTHISPWVTFPCPGKEEKREMYITVVSCVRGFSYVTMARNNHAATPAVTPGGNGGAA